MDSGSYRIRDAQLLVDDKTLLHHLAQKLKHNMHSLQYNVLILKYTVSLYVTFFKLTNLTC